MRFLETEVWVNHFPIIINPQHIVLAEPVGAGGPAECTELTFVSGRQVTITMSLADLAMWLRHNGNPMRLSQSEDC